MARALPSHRSHFRPLSRMELKAMASSISNTGPEIYDGSSIVTLASGLAGPPQRLSLPMQRLAHRSLPCRTPSAMSVHGMYFVSSLDSYLKNAVADHVQISTRTTS